MHQTFMKTVGIANYIVEMFYTANKIYMEFQLLFLVR